MDPYIDKQFNPSFSKQRNYILTEIQRNMKGDKFDPNV